MKKFLFFLLMFLGMGRTKILALETGKIIVNCYEDKIKGFNDGDFIFESILLDIELGLYNTNDELIETKTSIDGEVFFENLLYGDYYLVLGDKKFYFVVDSSCKELEIEIGHDILVLKGSFLEEIYEIDDGFKYSFVTFKDKKIDLYNSDIICNEDCETIVKKDTLISSFYTDLNGEFIYCNYLPSGEYYFLVNSKKFKFEVKEDLIIELPPFEVLIEKGDFEIIHQNYFDDSLVRGMEIKIYDINNNELFLRASIDGKIILNEFPMGEYFFVQTKTNALYPLFDEEVYFSIDDEKFILKDYPLETLPDTLKIDYKMLWGILFIVMAIFYKRVKPCALV